MKRNIFYLLFLVIGAWACSDEPEFPDPGLDATKSSIDTVRRDTIDTYWIAMNIAAPNGIDRIQVLNGRNYQVIEEFASEYRGQKDVQFEYPVDLTSINVDTTLQYIVKVIDQKMRSYNKGFTLHVRKFSSPDIKVVGGSDMMGLVSPVFELKALFETGLKPMASYRVLLENEVIDENVFSDTLVYQYAYKRMINAKMDWGKDYTIRIELKDNEGTLGVKEMKLRLIEMKRPFKIAKSTEKGVAFEMELFYDEERDRLNGMIYTRYSTSLVDGYKQTRLNYSRYEFEYSSDDLLVGWKRMTLDEELQDVDTTMSVVYTYVPGTKRLQTVDYEESKPTFAVTVHDWYDHGGVKSFYKGTSTLLIDNVRYVADPYQEGEVVYAAFWNSTVTAENFRQHCDNITAILIPTYFPELPNIMMGAFDADWLDLFMYKYVFERTVYTNRVPEEEVTRVTYSMDTMGRLVQLRRSQTNMFNRVTFANYIFTYKD